MLPWPSGLPFPDARVLSRQGMRPRRSFWHHGVDWARIVNGRSERGTPGGPVAWGHVEDVCLAGSPRCSGYGNSILVRHGDDLFSYYAHLDSILAAPGDEVWPLSYGGDPMYAVGVSFGTPDDPGRTLAVPHLHLEILHAGWPFSSRNTAARYDVLRELAASGMGLQGDVLVAGLDPFDYSEPLLVADVSKARDFSPAPSSSRWSLWPVAAAFAGIAGAGVLIALAPSRPRYPRSGRWAN